MSSRYHGKNPGARAAVREEKRREAEERNAVTPRERTAAYRREYAAQLAEAAR